MKLDVARDRKEFHGNYPYVKQFTAWAVKAVTHLLFSLQNLLASVYGSLAVSFSLDERYGVIVKSSVCMSDYTY